MCTDITHSFTSFDRRITEVLTNHCVSASIRRRSGRFDSRQHFSVHSHRLFAVLNKSIETVDHRCFLFIVDFLNGRKAFSFFIASDRTYFIGNLLVDQVQLRIAFPCGIIHSTERFQSITSSTTGLLVVTRNRFCQIPMYNKSKDEIFDRSMIRLVRRAYRTSALSMPMPKLIVAQIIVVCPFIHSCWIWARFSLVNPA